MKLNIVDNVNLNIIDNIALKTLKMVSKTL